MKITLSLCLLSAAACLTLAGDTPAPAAPRTLGRFRLFHGQYEQIGKAGATPHNGVFKIDSATGRTWMYHMLTDGKPMEGFFEVRNYDRNPQSAEDFLSETNAPTEKPHK